jgi:hypothetical protein
MRQDAADGRARMRGPGHPAREVDGHMPCRGGAGPCPHAWACGISACCTLPVRDAGRGVKAL